MKIGRNLIQTESSVVVGVADKVAPESCLNEFHADEIKPKRTTFLEVIAG